MICMFVANKEILFQHIALKHFDRFNFYMIFSFLYISKDSQKKRDLIKLNRKKAAFKIIFKHRYFF